MNAYLRTFSQTSIIVFGEEKDVKMQSVISSLKSNNIPFQQLSGDEVSVQGGSRMHTYVYTS